MESLSHRFERDDRQKVKDCWLRRPLVEVSQHVTAVISIISPEAIVWSYPYPLQPAWGARHSAISDIGTRGASSRFLQKPMTRESPFFPSFFGPQRSHVLISNWLADLSSPSRLRNAKSDILAISRLVLLGHSFQREPGDDS
jgi:hypothetical protein